MSTDALSGQHRHAVDSIGTTPAMIIVTPDGVALRMLDPRLHLACCLCGALLFGSAVLHKWRRFGEFAASVEEYRLLPEAAVPQRRWCCSAGSGAFVRYCCLLAAGAHRG